MKITVKLFATLGDLLPAGSRENATTVEVPDAATPNQVIDMFKVPRPMAHLVLINGSYLEPAGREQPVLKDQDVLAVWPPVAGGQ